VIGSVNQKRKNQALIACLRVEEYHRYMRIFTDIEAEMCPPSWKNERPLAKGEPLPLEVFPLIDEYMYVLESNFDDPEAGYQRWFRVGKQHYLKEWQAAIEASHQIVYQSNLEYNEQKNKR
jgi:hypothetical protein